MRATVGAAYLLGEDPERPELPGGLERQDDASGRRPGDQVDRRPRGLGVIASGTADVSDPERHELGRRRRVGEHGELLDIGVAMAPALELEVPVA